MNPGYPGKGRTILLIQYIAAIICILLAPGCSNNPLASYKGLDERLIHATKDSVIKERLYLNRDSTLSYHNVRLDQDGGILPWYSADLGESYDKVINLVWGFWDKMELDSNGIKYYMNHQVWRPEHDKRGLGGDQLMMALSSWDLLYNYTGNKAIVENMKYMADYYLSHGFSGPDDTWANLPYPYNTSLHSGIYDGDMILGKGYLQPDKAGSFGYELVRLYKKTGEEKYLDAAIKIANTLAAKVQPGDEFHSPWPFKVNAKTGEAGKLINKPNINKPEPGTTYKSEQESVYTTNWTPTLGLFTALTALGKGDAAAYTRAHDIALNWLKTFPAKNNKWGPFFEDILGWSDCQINAITYAMYLMDNEKADPDWKNTVKGIFQWVRSSLDDKEFAKYGVTTTDEQTIYRTPGNSHSSRQASMELRYWEMTGDTTRLTNAIRQLNWATYMVNTDGRNYYIRDDIWLTDGYGDYVRHYIRAMAAAPQLAPAKGDHLLRTSSVVTGITYEASGISYATFDNTSQERFRLQKKPFGIIVDGNKLNEVTNGNMAGYLWQTIGKDGGGVLTLNKEGSSVKIYK
ncbi:hypothetical protein [Flavihumibacter profundi]|uniref:hypothetical protein n=1 Tax=Flavihumibacter profundi TaxID=2716883 RepID=UPI001CC60487|nr:hypothetical protein [Flavihumibacter profundi]MBZ5858145.1 hypothetical protein [Flavihumibacter profundi]